MCPVRVRTNALRGVIFALTTLVGVAAPVVTRAAEYDQLGRLEREAVDDALSSRKLTIDRKPEGKTIGRVIVVTQPVFSRRDGFLQWFNLFHFTTYPPIVDRELLVKPGDPWTPETQARVEESRRNLLDPFLANVIVLLPVVATNPQEVDVLVVLRDVWSLRLNTNFEVQDGILTQLSMSLSENNLFGLRKKLALAFRLDQGVYELGPVYIDPNIRGTRMTLEVGARAIFNRDTNVFEGSRSALELAYPLWSLKEDWGASIAVSHYDSKIRFFRGAGLLTYDVPETVAEEELPIVYDFTRLSAASGVIRGFGETVEHRVSFGHELSMQLPRLPEDFMGSSLERDAFARDIFPRRELASAFFVSYRLFTPTYHAVRDFDTFDLREDLRTGPSLDLRASRAMTEIGSDVDFMRFSAEASWSFALGGDGFARAASGWSARLQDGRLFDHLVSNGVYVGTPRFFKILRLHTSASASFLLEESNNRFFTLGGDSGLRGYPIGFFTGEAKVEGHVELRTRPMPIWFTRLGAVAFYDTGHAADSTDELVLHHDVGGGLRFLIPQLDPYVMRLDWALPLTGATKGLPGRFTLGFYQVF